MHARTNGGNGGLCGEQVSDQMPGASGAEIKAVCTEAGMYALRERRVHVTQEDFEMAAVKVFRRSTPRFVSIHMPALCVC